MADFEPLFELKNQYRESCPVLLQSGALYREEPTASAEAEETETVEVALPAEQEEAASPRIFLRLAFRNIDPRAVTSVYVDIHIFDKATNELAVVRDRRYLVPILGRDAVFGADEEIDVDDAAYSFSVAIKKVQFEGEDVFWNGSASLLFENLPEQAKIADVMEDEDLRAQYQRDFTEMAEDKEAAAQFVPQEYKDLWMCACGEVNHKDEEKCAACGAEYGPQHALFEDEEKLKENLEAYNKAEAEKAEAARIAAEKKAAEEKAAAEAAARKAAEEKAAAEEAARKKRLHRKIFLSVSIPLAVLIAAFVVVLIVYIIPKPASMTKPSPRSRRSTDTATAPPASRRQSTKKPATCSKTRNSQKPSKPSPPSAITKTAKIGSPRPSTAVPSRRLKAVHTKTR